MSISLSSSIKYVLIHIVLFLTATLIVGSFITSLFTNEVKSSSGFDAFDYVIVILLAPLLETLFFQKLIIDYLSKNQMRTIYIIAISALVFTVYHLDFSAYFIYTLFAGLYLAYMYIDLERKKMNSFVWTWMAHSIHNLIMVIGLS